MSEADEENGTEYSRILLGERPVTENEESARQDRRPIRNWCKCHPKRETEGRKVGGKHPK